MGRKVFVVGVGMTKFEKPGARSGTTPTWRRRRARKALEDAGISYDQVEQAAVGYCYGDSTAGQRALYEIGLTGIPVVTSTTTARPARRALFLAQAVRRGRPRRLRAGARLREDGEGLARHQVHGPREADAEARSRR